MAGAPDRERWRRIDEILDHAFELSGQEREAFVGEACAGDAELRDEVVALLRAGERELTLPGLPAAMAAALDAGEAAAGGPAAGGPTAGSPAAGERIGPYRIVGLIGRGGMGDVFEAVDPRLGRHVAIKLLPRRRDRRPGAEERFLREARAASALDHPNICTVHDVGETERGDPYLVMGYYAGETLEARLAKGPLPIEEACDLARQVARGLERAHEAGIVHRDVKPANVLVTERGEAKILDFGIARLLGDASLTQTGARLGTPAYMSPEQARGEAADERTDVWALGLLLYEMIAGAKPFAGDNARALVHAILNRDPIPLGQRRAGVPGGLERVVMRALARDRAWRYPTMTELLTDLEPPVLGAPQARRWRSGLLAAVLAIGLGALTIALWPRLAGRVSGPETNGSSPATTPEAVRTETSPTLAVFRFRNLSGEPELDWLAGGIAEMLLTSLSQSPEIGVVGSGRLAQVATELELPPDLALDPAAVPIDLIRRAADLGAFDAAVTGGFARAGSALRIVLQVTAAADGEILKSHQADGEGEASLFAMIDELSAAVRNRFEPLPAARPGRVQEITTASLEAWRFYTEALALDRQAKRQEAIVLLEKAVDVDPGFALALAALGKLHKNLGRVAEARELTRRAVEHAERLPPDQRHEIAGAFYATRWSTLGLAIEAYEEAVRLHPEKEAQRNNLARLYSDFERYQEAEREYRALVDAGSEYVGTIGALANTYAALGRFETGHRLLSDFARDRSENWLLWVHRGWYLTEWGRLEEALARFGEASRLRPGEFFVHYARWRTLALLDRWPEARLEAESMRASDRPFERWRGAVSEARNQTYRGRSESALASFDDAIGAWAEPDAFGALARCWKADLLLAREDAAGALVEAERAMEEGEGEWPGLQARFHAALAHQRLGRPEAADRLVAELRQRASRQPNRVEERQIHHLEGLLALARGDAAGGLAALRRAEALLPPQGVEVHWHVYPRHVSIWVALGRAELGAGRIAEAARWLERAATCGAERLESPVAYVRGLFLLGECHRRLGREAEARRWLGRFLEHWRHGDLDRAWVESAGAL